MLPLKKLLALPLLVSRIGTNDPDDAPAADDLAIFTNTFYGTTNLHNTDPKFTTITPPDAAGGIRLIYAR